ncbi:MAG: sulfatase [Gammaproteobacteria bacterium]|nr:sulfatase [Gammaproteobacteria bacterium]MBT6891700.1 sulfatase [Gammaproteobacteria bacterium]
MNLARTFEPAGILILLLLLEAPGAVASSGNSVLPNIIVILTDDMGYGDIGAYGNTQIDTPHIDAIAQRGVLLTNGYASANVCTPSRAGLLTGRYAIRSGLAWKVVQAGDQRSLPASEQTMAELVKGAGYQAGMVGKWHLGSFPGSSPMHHGFDYFLGVPHSNDMPDFALYEGEEIIEYPVDQRSLTRRYTEAATSFIADSADAPFLLYVAHTFPHIPLYASSAFAGKSRAGMYGDVVQEIDWSTGEIVDELRRNNLLENTLIIFTSDNGPFFEGSTAGLKGGKGNAWEGGYRVPFIVSWPAVITGGRSLDTLAINIDILPTIAEVVDRKPRAEIIDGQSLLPALVGRSNVENRYFYYFNNEAVVGLRDAAWKFMTHAYYTTSIGAFEKFDQLPGFESSYDLLFDARALNGESYSVAEREPETVVRFKRELLEARKEFDLLRTRPAEKTYPN